MNQTVQRGLAASLLALFVIGGQICQGQAPPADDAKAPEETGEHPLKAAIKLTGQARQAAKELGDYTAIFSKREVVRGQMFASQMRMKFRPEPLSVYLRFVNPEHAGREVLYVEGRNNGQMLAHEAGGIKSLVGTVSVDPNGQMALAEARHSVTHIGIENLAVGVAAQWERESAFGECDVKYYNEAKLGERPVLVIESSHPTRRKQFQFAVTRLWLDKETRLPVRCQQYDFPAAPGGEPVLVEDYTYTDIKSEAELTEADFDPRNPAYQF
ncbi:MAG: DUF1571 domain-containing protein [Planctomycetaceae bacterium]